MKLQTIIHQLQPDGSVKVSSEILEVPEEDTYDKHDKRLDNAWMNDPRAACTEDRLFMRYNGLKV